jgi:hypothetical protein
VIVSLAAVLAGRRRAPAGAADHCLAIFAGIGIVIALMGLDRGGLPVVDTRLWGGLLVTLVVSVTGIVASMPVGIALALGRRSTIPLIRIFSIAFIEFWRGVPLITVLFFAINKWYGDFHVLRDINLEVAKGERIVICGPSGSGKSTLIRCINRAGGAFQEGRDRRRRHRARTDDLQAGSTKSGARSAWCSRASTCSRI